MALTAEPINPLLNLFLIYTDNNWTTDPVFIPLYGYVPNLDAWLKSRWDLILTDTKSLSAKMMAEDLGKVLLSPDLNQFLAKVPTKCQFIWHFPTHLEYPPVRILTKSVRNANNAIVKVKIQFTNVMV